MKATKEEAMAAHSIIKRYAHRFSERDYQALYDFITACQKRLPTALAVANDRIRKLGKNAK
jgi:hypothetical protein